MVNTDSQEEGFQILEIYLFPSRFKALYLKNTADEAIASRCVMGSPTNLTVFLKYRSWLKTFPACMEIYC